MKLLATAQFTPREDTGRFIEAIIAPKALAATQEVGETILTRAKEKVPVDTGELRESGEVIVRQPGRSAVADVQFTAAHAGYVEYGTGRRGAASPGAGPYPYNLDWPGMTAQPYLRPAVEETRAEMVGEFALKMRF